MLGSGILDHHYSNIDSIIATEKARVCISMLDQLYAAAGWCLLSCVSAQVINRIQKLRKHAGLVASEPVEVWLAEGCRDASQGAAGAATSSGAVSRDSAMGAAAAAPAAAHAANEERAEANGLAADVGAAAVPLSSLLELQVGPVRCIL